MSFRILRCFTRLPAPLLAGVVALLGPIATRADDAADRLALAVDTLTRLEGIDLNANAAMKERVLKILEKTRGTPGFVRLVRHFNLSGQENGLIEVATALPRDEFGVEGLRWLLDRGPSGAGLGILRTNLARGDTNAVALAEAVGNTGHRDSPKLLLPLLSLETAGASLRSQAARSLARSAEGARELLAAVKADRITGDLRKVALDELTQVRWDDIRKSASDLRGPGNAALPPVAELIKRTGDAANGETVFRRVSPGCASCHVARGFGVELGPNLSEIGSKLTREALYQAILEPSAGISFGYEAFTITLKDDEEVYGLLASETPDELAIRTVGGVITRYKKSNVIARQKSTLSIMPAGLEAGMTAQELVDLVEYLVSLKKAP